MSKSSESPNGVIGLLDSKEDIIKKIKGATTDSDMLVKFDEENKPGISNLLTIVSSLTGKDIQDIEKEFVGKNYGEFKNYVAETVVNYLEPIQKRYHEFVNSSYVDELLDQGISKSRELAKNKYELLREKVGTRR